MSETNIAIVRGVYDAAANGDIAAMMANFSPDLRIEQTPELPWGGVFEGLDGFGRFISTLREHIASRVAIERIFAAGDNVVVIGRTIGATKAKGTPFEVQVAHVLTVKDGRIVAMRYFIDTPAMLAVLRA